MASFHGGKRKNMNACCGGSLGSGCVLVIFTFMGAALGIFCKWLV